MTASEMARKPTFSRSQGSKMAASTTQIRKVELPAILRTRVTALFWDAVLMTRKTSRLLWLTCQTFSRGCISPSRPITPTAKTAKPARHMSASIFQMSLTKLRLPDTRQFISTGIRSLREELSTTALDTTAQLAAKAAILWRLMVSLVTTASSGWHWAISRTKIRSSCLDTSTKWWTTQHWPITSLNPHNCMIATRTHSEIRQPLQSLLLLSSKVRTLQLHSAAQSRKNLSKFPTSLKVEATSTVISVYLALSTKAVKLATLLRFGW